MGSKKGRSNDDTFTARLKKFGARVGGKEESHMTALSLSVAPCEFANGQLYPRGFP